MSIMAHLIASSQSPFDSIKRSNDDGKEFWLARELQPLLGYVEWRNFQPIILKVFHLFHVLGQNPSDWVVEFNKPIESGKGRLSQVTEYKLTKQSCYLIAMNCDSSKPEIALAQAYFASMTIFAEQVISKSNERERKTELFSEKNHQLANEIGQKAREFLTENIALKAEIAELKQRLGKLDIPALPPSDGVRVKELLRCCGVTINSNDGSLFSQVALDIRRAVQNGELPSTAIANRGRYRYSPSVELWLKNWLFRYERLNEPLTF